MPSRDETVTALMGEIDRVCRAVARRWDVDPPGQDDAAQEGVVACLMVYDRAATKDRPEGYLIGVARRRVLTAIREGKLRARHSTYQSSGRRKGRESMASELPEDALDRASADPASAVEVRDSVSAALRAMTPGQARTAVMIHLQGGDVQTVARKLGVRPVTVYQRLSRGAEAARNALT